MFTLRKFLSSTTKYLLQHFFRTNRGNGVKRFCYVTVELNNVLTLHPVTKEEEDGRNIAKNGVT